MNLLKIFWSWLLARPIRIKVGYFEGELYLAKRIPPEWYDPSDGEPFTLLELLRG